MMPLHPDARTYNSRAKLTDLVEAGERGIPDPNRSALVESVLDIEGIIFCRAHVYSLTVVKASSFDWYEIDGPMTKLIDAFNIGEGRLNAEPEDLQEDPQIDF